MSKVTTEDFSYRLYCIEVLTENFDQSCTRMFKVLTENFDQRLYQGCTRMFRVLTENFDQSCIMITVKFSDENFHLSRTVSDFSLTISIRDYTRVVPEFLLKILTRVVTEYSELLLKILTKVVLKIFQLSSIVVINSRLLELEYSCNCGIKMLLELGRQIHLIHSKWFLG